MPEPTCMYADTTPILEGGIVVCMRCKKCMSNNPATLEEVEIAINFEFAHPEGWDQHWYGAVYPISQIERIMELAALRDKLKPVYR